MKDSYQKGSALAIVVIILAVVILGLVGYIFYTNFIAPKSNSADTTSQTPTPAKTADTTAPSALSETATANYNGRSLTIKYPSKWTNDATNGTITSPDGNTIVRYNLTPPNGIGGTCGDYGTANPVLDPIVSANWEAISGRDDMIFASRITRYIPTDAQKESFSYEYDVVENRAAIKTIKAGDSTCEAFIFANFVTLDKTSGAVLQLKTSFQNLDDSVKTNSTKQALIETTLKGDDATTAKAIMESLVLK